MNPFYRKTGDWIMMTPAAESPLSPPRHRVGPIREVGGAVNLP